MIAGVVCVSVIPPTSQTKETSRTFSICRMMWKVQERSRCRRFWKYYVIQGYVKANLGWHRGMLNSAVLLSSTDLLVCEVQLLCTIPAVYQCSCERSLLHSEVYSVL
jgi:hypothetical protein